MSTLPPPTEFSLVNPREILRQAVRGASAGQDTGLLKDYGLRRRRNRKKPFSP